MQQWPDNMQPTNRSLENPNTPPTADDWLLNAFGGGPSIAGPRISRESALTYSPWWRGINLISDYVAKIPLVVYKRKGDDGANKERDKKHPAYSVLRRKFCPWLTAFYAKKTIQSHALAHGNGYGYIARKGNGRVAEIRPLMPDITYPVRENGVLYYVTKDADGQWKPIAQMNVLHVKGLGFDGLCGYSVFLKAKQSLGLGMAVDQFTSRYFSNNARPSTVIEVPGPMKADAQVEFLRQWNAMQGGLENAHKTAVITNGAKVNAFSNDARESQLAELRGLNPRDIANFLCLPPHKLGDMQRQGYNSLEQENQSFLDDSLDPWLVNWEEECEDKLLTEDEKSNETHDIEFLRNAIIRADVTARGQFYNLGIMGGWLLRDEARAKENMNPLPNGEGQKAFVPMNMAIAGEKPPEDKPKPIVPVDEPPPDEPNRATVLSTHRALLSDTVARMVKRLATHAVRNAKDRAKLQIWLDHELDAEHRDVISQAVLPVVAACESLRGGNPTDSAKSLIDDMLSQFRRDLLEIIEHSESVDVSAAVRNAMQVHQEHAPGIISGKLISACEQFSWSKTV